MKNKLLVPFVTVVLAMLFLLLYYYSGKPMNSDTQTLTDLVENDTLKFSSSWAGYDTNAIPLKAVLDRFREANANLNVLDESMAGEDFLFTLKTDFATGNEPDVFGLWPGSDFEMLVKQGKVADLTDVLKDDLAWYHQFNDEAWKYVTVNDRIYGLPFEIIYEGLFVNYDMFQMYEIKVPTTYEELLTAVKEFRRHGIIPIAFNTTPEGSFIYQNIVMKLGGKEDVEHPFTTSGKLKTCFLEGMEVMKELYDLGAFPEEAFLIDDKSRNDLFMNKQAAMIVQGSWFIGEQGVNPQDATILILPFPAFPSGKGAENGIIYGCGNGIFHMSQKAWEDPVKQKYGLDLLKTLTSVETATTFQSAGGFISNVKLPEDAISTSYLYSQGERLIENAKELVGPTDSFIDRVIWEDIIVAQFELMLKGNVLPKEVIVAAEEGMKGIKP